QEALRDDRRLSSEMQLAVAFAPSLVYIAVTDPHGIILAHNNPEQIGQPLPPARPFRDLVDAGLIRELLILGIVPPAIDRIVPASDYPGHQVIHGQLHVFEIAEQLNMRDRPLCFVRVGTSTVLLAAQIRRRVRTALEYAFVAVLVVALVIALLPYLV